MKKRILHTLLLIFLAAILVSLLWELGHSKLYDWNKEPLKNDFNFYIYRILKSTIGDGIFILLIFLLNSLFRHNFKWISEPRKRDFFILAVLGIAFAILIEIRARMMNLWSYNELMPTIFGIGVTPLIQLAATSMIILIVLRKVLK
ncbi:MAG: hypothetical protein ABIH72_00575 [archaeon]